MTVPALRPMLGSPALRHRSLALLAALLALGAAVVERGPGIDPAQLADDIDSGADHIGAPALAERIMRHDATLRIFDLRSRPEYEQFHIPTAEHTRLEDLSRMSFRRGETIVLYSEGGTLSAQAWVLLRLRGYRDVFFLREGLYEWLARVHEPRLATDATANERAEFERAARQSRFFGGLARSDVPRAEVPAGYWTNATGEGAADAAHAAEPALAAAARGIVARVRRRGC